LCRVVRRLAVGRDDVVARLQSRLGGGRAFDHLVNHGGLDAEVWLEFEVAYLVAVFIRHRRLYRERHALSFALDDDGKLLVPLHRRNDVHPAPRRVLLVVERDDSVARFESRRVRRAALLDLTDDRSERGHADHHRADEGNRERRQDVHHGPGDADEKLLPAWPEVETFARGNLFARALFESGVRLVAAELDVAAERDERESVVRSPPASPPDALAESDREGLDAYAEQLSDEEVAEVVQDDGGAEYEDEGEYVEQVHKIKFLRTKPKPRKRLEALPRRPVVSKFTRACGRASNLTLQRL